MPPICDFAEHPWFLGKRPYPRQRTLLKLINLELDAMDDYDLEVIDEWTSNFYQGPDRIGISPDAMVRARWLKERGYPHFPEVVNISGRRGSKGLIGAIQGAYQNWRLLQTDDPQWYYGVERGKELYFYVTATGLNQAKAYQFADLANALTAPCFKPHLFSVKPTYISLQTAADKRRVGELVRRGIVLEREIASIINIAISANSAASRGGAAFGWIADEFAHMLSLSQGPRTDSALYNAIQPSLAQMGKDGFLYIPSSPLTKVGRCYELYCSALDQSEDGHPLFPHMLVVQLPSEFIYYDYDDHRATRGKPFRSAPMVYDESARALEAREPDVYRVERKAQWAEVEKAWLNPTMVDRMFQPFVDPLTQIERVLYPQDNGVFQWIYRGHIDPSKSRAGFAVLFGHCEPIRGDDGEVFEHVFVDWYHRWDPAESEDHQVDYIEIEKELVRRIVRFPAMGLVSVDSYGSFVTIPRLRQELAASKSRARVTEVTFSGPENKKRNEAFKSLLGLDWIHAYKDDLGPDGQSMLELELKFLQDKNGKVQPPKVGPVTTDDIADCLQVVATELLGEQLEKLKRRERLGNTSLTVGAQGGYHSGQAPPDERSAARVRLSALNRGTARSGYDYGPRRLP